jgi:hypothetical protein
MMPTLKGVARPSKPPYSGSFLIRHGQVLSAMNLDHGIPPSFREEPGMTLWHNGIIMTMRLWQQTFHTEDLDTTDAFRVLNTIYLRTAGDARRGRPLTVEMSDAELAAEALVTPRALRLIILRWESLGLIPKRSGRGNRRYGLNYDILDRLWAAEAERRESSHPIKCASGDLADKLDAQLATYGSDNNLDDLE